MTAATQKLGDRPFLSRFFISLWAVVLVLLLAGMGGFWYLTVNSPLGVLAGGDRPIAAATAFVPSRSPFTLSLLTQPDRLLAFQQAITEPALRLQARHEVEQLKQDLLDSTGLDYDHDIQPWIGSEITFALVNRELKLSAQPQNSAQPKNLEAQVLQQPGYLLALEIAPGRLQAAREFLQFFWQRQSLAGYPPETKQINGARVLYRPQTGLDGTESPITAASALVGEQFLLFANDVRVLQQSLHSAQNGFNLAQNRAYRQAAAGLPTARIGLAYVDTSFLGEAIGLDPEITPSGSPMFTPLSFELSRSGLLAHAKMRSQITSQTEVASESDAQLGHRLVGGEQFLPLTVRSR
ncbi:MAG: DUF3352 domain-containing protein [Phormidesmis sp. RL_2_1]|nr:DUF3352 domain-containing protein [Phormidesmis sp. RL_2_1]